MAYCLVRIEKQGKVDKKRLEGEKFTFGRALENAIVLQHESISRSHLEMAIKNGKIYLKDLGSSNGSYLNGKKFSPKEIKEYNPGDILRLGNAEQSIQIDLLTEEEAAAKDSLLPKFPLSFGLGKPSNASPTPPPPPSAPPMMQSQVTDEMIKNAQERAEMIAKKAEEKVQESRERAEQEAQKILKAAEEKAQENRERAEQEARRIIKAAEESALAAGKAKEAESIRQAEQAARTASAKIHEEARSALEAAQVRARKELESARTEADKTLQIAQQDAVKIIEDTKKAAAEIEKSSESFLQQAKESAEKYLSLKKQEAEEEKADLLKRWEKEHKSLKEEISSYQTRLEEKKLQFTQAENLEKEAQERLKKKESELKSIEQQFHQKDSMLKECESKMDQVKARIEGFERQLTDLKKDKEEALLEAKSIRSKAQNDQESLEKEYVHQKERIRVEMAELRQKELNDIQKLRLDELDNLDKLRRQAVGDIQKNQDVFTKGLSEKLEGRVLKVIKDSSGSNYQALKSEVHKLVLESFDEQIFEVGQSFEKDIRTEVKAATQNRKQGLKRAAGLSIAAVVSLVGIFIFQGGNVWNALQGMNEAGLTAAEQYSRKMYNERAELKFQPLLVPGLKDSYTDNVLYTPEYVNKMQNSETREKWIKILNRFLTRDLSLEDDSVVQLVAIESTLVSRLKAEREQINPEYVEISVKKMQKLEDESEAKIRRIFKNQGQYDRYLKLSKEFWSRELESGPEVDSTGRVPANK